jgi:glyoxylase-like metal-dependent hydrolase (beta-lactamase superfamily II)
MVARLFDGSVFPVDGDVEVVPGVSLHWVGGHTAGLQVVRVLTETGWLVLASDLIHYYENFQLPNLFPIVYRPEQMLDAFTRVRNLASDPRLIIPGHDPEVMKRFAAEPEDAEHTVRLWLPN